MPAVTSCSTSRRCSLKKVLAWVREHGHEYGADPAMVFATGSSRAPIWPRWLRPRPMTRVPARLRACGHLGHRRHWPGRLRRPSRHQGAAVVTPGVRRTRCAAVLRGARRSGHAGARGRRPTSRRGVEEHPRRIPLSSRSSPGPSTRSTCSTPSASRRSSRQDRGLHRLGAIGAVRHAVRLDRSAAQPRPTMSAGLERSS
jgi:hypothetical protein